MNSKEHGCCRCAVMAVGAVLLLISFVSAGEIRVWPTGAVAGESIRLSDVAEIRGFDVSTTERLSGLAVSAAPREGGEIEIQAGDLRGALAEAGVNLVEATVVGSSRCTISRPR